MAKLLTLIIMLALFFIIPAPILIFLIGVTIVYAVVTS